MPDRYDRDPRSLHGIHNDIRSATKHQFADSRFCSHAAQIGVTFERFYYGDDARSQSTGSVRLVLGDISSNFFQACSCEVGPDNLH
jgi:hypothetical protein